MTTEQPTIKLPVKPLINPLTEDDRIKLEQVIAQLPVIEDLLHRAANCGLDVQSRMEQHHIHKTIAHKLKEHFFPDHLPVVQE